jgi:microcin C transport system substrate-binding protein
LAFDFEWTNANIMYGSYKRVTSYFENTDMKAEGTPSPEELALLDPFRASLPKEVFGEPVTPPVSDGSGQDRRLLRRADELLREAGCKRDGSILKLPNGQPFTIEFLDFQSALQPHTQPFQANLKKLGIEARSRIVDAAQYQRRMDEYDFDISSRALSGAGTPGDSLRIVYGSQAAKTPGSRNIAGIADPAVDALVERISVAKTRKELVVACRALDRVLRAGLYWVPMWYKASDWLAYWDEFDRPATKPELDSGAPATWWHDAEKAKRIGRG